MSLTYDEKHRTVKDNLSGVTLKHNSGKGDQGTGQYIFFDPAVSATLRAHTTRPPGTVALDWNFIYARAPIPTAEGRPSWGKVAGYRVSTIGIHELYRAHLGVVGEPTTELRARISAAMAFLRDAIAFDWQRDQSRAAPLIDLDGSLSSEVRCYIPRYPQDS